MSYQVGSFRFDRIKYNSYSVYFDDISGVNKKSDVKISGVKVGWVDAVELVSDGQQVRATLLINKKYVLHDDAYAIVRQEGFLGGKYLELVPGSPTMPTLPAGGMITRPSQSPVVIDQLLHQFQAIATNVESITKSFSHVLGGDNGALRLNDLIENMQAAAQHIASFSASLENIMKNNETTINGIFTDLQGTLRDIQAELPRLSNNLQFNADRISSILDRDFNRVATQLEGGMAPIKDIAEKISSGKGILGQLISDDGAYQDLRVAINGVKQYFDKVDKIGIIFDVYTESMSDRIEGKMLRNGKGYFNLRIHPAEDYFYLAGLVAAQSGFIERYEKHRVWFDDKCRELVPGDLNLDDDHKLKYAPVKRVQKRYLDSILFNLQIGKIFNRIAFRAGMFESTGGVAVDVDIPLNKNRIRWVTSLEMFDMTGRQRFADDRPHLKWLNKMFFTENLYFTFGADDFISRHNKNAFVGMGIRFADDDVKYLLSSINFAG